MASQSTLREPDSKKFGQWSPTFDLKNVAVHAHLLPNGKVLYWGRRSNPKSPYASSMSEHVTEPWVLDPATRISEPTKGEFTNNGYKRNQPKLYDGKMDDKLGEDVNLFCSGHTFQPDGTLLVAGGHIRDGWGVNQACVYDYRSDTWTPKQRMNDGRWYPSVIALPDGGIFVLAGNRSEGGDNGQPQIWRTDKWTNVTEDNKTGNFPRMHLHSSGRIFVAGPTVNAEFLDVGVVSKGGTVGIWDRNPKLERPGGDRQYAPSVMYESDKIMIIGGGSNDEQAPLNTVEFIDLNDTPPKWTTDPLTDMNHARRHHNATILPDGTVLVTGGTEGPGFNNVDAAVHAPELFNPTAPGKKWTVLAPEREDRCYHGTALLLPDAQVLSAGSGEWGPGDNDNPPGNTHGLPNASKDSITNAQLFKPPYFFNSPRPRPIISQAPTEIQYKSKFDVTVSFSDTIEKASFISIGSVTHTINMNQFFTFLECQQQGTKVTVTAPTNPNITPAGFYMLFLLNQDRVPSVAPIIQLLSPPPPPKPQPDGANGSKPATYTVKEVPASVPAVNKQLIAEHTGPPVVVGLTPICPYGLNACWASAFHGLQTISDIKAVDPSPDGADSVASVYLHEDIVPDVDKWRGDLAKTVKGAYQLRGLEMTLSGLVSQMKAGSGEEQLTMAGTATRPDVVLTPFKEADNLRIYWVSKAPKPITEEEAGAFARLSALVADDAAGATVQVTGLLHKNDANYFWLNVRQFKAADGAVAT
ncbi:MAG: hypothetical protein LQ351_004874 [Letrouitia transgressa]|nr:MAG: hypothetical protein LQ351_004874 [Letrouitia transgressa]